MRPTQPQRVLALAHAQTVLRPRDLDALGIPRTVLGRLVVSGELVRVGRGLYMRPDVPITPYHSLVEVATRVPGAVVNLVSALAFHGLTDELPAAVWIALRQGRHAPQLESPRLELTWTSPRFLEIGVTRHPIEGVDVPVTDAARTVVDCFKYRSKVGIDVAVAALREHLARERTGRPALWAMARHCRMQGVLRPYLETLS